MSDVYVLGVDMIKFGRFPDRTVPDLGAEAALLALDDAGLNIGNMEAFYCGNLGQANYTASKAGIIAMSKSLAIEYAKKNININCISPGFIKTAMTDKIDDKFKEIILSKIPSARLGEPEDVANAVIFLTSDQSNYINGETLHVNGGMYMAWQNNFLNY